MRTILDTKVINAVEIREINAKTKHHGKCNSTDHVFFSCMYLFYIDIDLSKKVTSSVMIEALSYEQIIIHK